MKDLGLAKQILGMSIIRDRMKGILRLSQEKYIGKVLEKFNMKDVKARYQPLANQFKLSKKQVPKTKASRRRMAKVPYASIVGSVMYTIKAVILEAFSNSDYGGCLDSGKSNVGYVFTMGEASKELVWLKNFLEELDTTQTECVIYPNKNHELSAYLDLQHRDIKEILGDTTQRDIKEILGDTIQIDIEEILEDITQRDIEEILGDTTQIDIKEILGDTTQIDIKEILGDTTQIDIEEVLGDTTQRDIFMYLGNNISG
ncbi:hypothetical protein Tco_0813591 [Tanacetum coccineum]